MAIKLKFKDTEFGVGDKVRVVQSLKEGGKERYQYFDGIVIAIRGSKNGKSFAVRRIGAQQVGIEKIFPIENPNLKEIKVIKKGNVRRAKLYYIRNKSRRYINRIYQRLSSRVNK